MSNILFSQVLETSASYVSSNIQTSSNYTVTNITSGSLTFIGTYSEDITTLLAIVWEGNPKNTPIFLNIISSLESSSIEFPTLSVSEEALHASFEIATSDGSTTLTTSSNNSFYFRDNESIDSSIQLIYYKSIQSISEHTPSKFLQFTTGSLNELDFLIVSTDNGNLISSSLLLSSSLALSQSLLTQIGTISSTLSAVSSSLNTTSNLISDLVSIIDDTNASDGKLGLNLTGVWGETTPPSGSSLIAEQKESWGNGDIPIIRNASRDGQQVFGVLGDPDGFLQVRLISDGGNSADYILFLPYYSSSYSS